jgi:hypothetical protein
MIQRLWARMLKNARLPDPHLEPRLLGKSRRPKRRAIGSTRLPGHLAGGPGWRLGTIAGSTSQESCSKYAMLYDRAKQ